MTKLELIHVLSQKSNDLSAKDVREAVNIILECVADGLAGNKRIEIRRFGTMSLRSRKARIGRNPKTGEPVSVPRKSFPHFKPGRELRDRVNQ